MPHRFSRLCHAPRPKSGASAKAPYAGGLNANRRSLRFEGQLNAKTDFGCRPKCLFAREMRNSGLRATGLPPFTIAQSSFLREIAAAACAEAPKRRPMSVFARGAGAGAEYHVRIQTEKGDFPGAAVRFAVLYGTRSDGSAPGGKCFRRRGGSKAHGRREHGEGRGRRHGARARDKGGRRRDAGTSNERRGRCGLRKTAQAPSHLDDRHRRLHRHGAVPRRGRPPGPRRRRPHVRLRHLRHLRLPHGPRPRRAVRAPPLLGRLRLLRARVPRREGRLHHGLAVLPRLVDDGHGRHHGGGPLHALLGRLHARAPVGHRARGPRARLRVEHDEREDVRRGGVLVCRHQSSHHHRLHGRRHRLHHLGRAGGRLARGHLQHHRARRPFAHGAVGGLRADAWRGLRVRRHRDGGRRGRRGLRRRGQAPPARHQLDDHPHLRLLRGLGHPHGARLALHGLLFGRVALRHLLRRPGRALRRHHHPNRRFDGGAVLAQRRPLRHGSHPALHGHRRLGPEVCRAHEQAPGALRRHRHHLGVGLGGRAAERAVARGRLQHHHEPRGHRHRGHLDDDSNHAPGLLAPGEEG